MSFLASSSIMGEARHNGNDYMDEQFKANGMYFVDTSTLIVDDWDSIETVIRDYTAIHPMEVHQIVLENAVKRETSLSATGANKSGTVRQSVSVPTGLYFKLQQVMPDLFNNQRKLRHFMRKYQGFRTCRTI